MEVFSPLTALIKAGMNVWWLNAFSWKFFRMVMMVFILQIRIPLHFKNISACLWQSNTKIMPNVTDILFENVEVLLFSGKQRSFV
jgi:hypothetical protein